MFDELGDGNIVLKNSEFSVTFCCSYDMLEWKEYLPVLFCGAGSLPLLHDAAYITTPTQFEDRSHSYIVLIFSFLYRVIW